MKRKLDYAYCKAAPVLEWMSHKWTLVILLRIEAHQKTLGKRGIRFGDLFRTIPAISEKMLASTLEYLEGEGLVFRQAHNEASPHVEYTLTPLAEKFLREIEYVMEWGQIHYSEIMEARNRQQT